MRPGLTAGALDPSVVSLRRIYLILLLLLLLPGLLGPVTFPSRSRHSSLRQAYKKKRGRGTKRPAQPQTRLDDVDSAAHATISTPWKCCLRGLLILATITRAATFLRSPLAAPHMLWRNMMRAATSMASANVPRPLLRGVVFDMDGTLTLPNLDFDEAQILKNPIYSVLT
jgi:hypothetical protein